MKLNNLPRLRTFRRSLRNNLTPAEARLWSLIKDSQLEGRKFRRQHSFSGFILDFYCPCEKLAVELDGKFHFSDRAMQYDNERKLFLQYFGILVLRFENGLVFDAEEWVIETIRSAFGWKRERERWIDE